MAQGEKTHEINLDLIRKTVLHNVYKEIPQADTISKFKLEIDSIQDNALVTGSINFENEFVLKEFKQALRDKDIPYFSHSKVTASFGYKRI